MKNDVQHVFLIGAKNVGAYGGYETFINVLTEYHQNNPNIQYHVACKASGEGYMDESKLDNAVRISDTEFRYHNARCFKVPVPRIGPAQAIYYDVAAFAKCCQYIQEHNIAKPIVYILACRIGPFMQYFVRRIHKLGGQVFINPDGHEWKRAKWNAMVRRYWKISEGLMVKYCDKAICDSVHIEQYIHESYDKKGVGGKNPETTYISYGAKLCSQEDAMPDDALLRWYQENNLKAKEYYLLVGRFVPENNYETVVREFMASDTKKDLAIVTTCNEKFLEALQQKLHFENDSRIKFLKPVYDQRLLTKIRANAYAYIHGHEVGGTNPSLLEALASTPVNLLLDVGFNREVAEDSAVYWNKTEGNLSALIHDVDSLDQDTYNRLDQLSRERIQTRYDWAFICNQYEKIFTGSLL